jgi:glucosamine--fructose-6-phosphate aminotransferase (isomerizing)
MCGIIGYIGKKNVCPILIKGLELLEYRGYDSAGIAILNNHNKIEVYKKKGKVLLLKSFIKNKKILGGLGIAHTRWATHGEPSDRNSHPHISMSGKIAIVHNGIIENYQAIKKILLAKGYVFKSDTDTEVLVNLIEDIKENTHTKIDEAVRLALEKVVGAYAIVVMSSDEEDTLVVAKKGSPVVIGVGDGEYFIASDATPIVEYTDKVIYLNDNEIAIIKKDKLVIKTIKNIIKNPYVQKLDIKLEELGKEGFAHFMLKEIYEQPRSIKDSMRGRINIKTGEIKLGGIEKFEDKFINAERIIILACGTSWHAGLEAKYFFEELAKIPVSVEYASEFRYRNPVIYKNDLVIAISQSGETADTLAALNLAKSMGATIFGVCNVVGSSIPRNTDAGIYTHAGPEIGVASTKAFTAQLTVLMLICLKLALLKKTLSKIKVKKILCELENVPAKIEIALKKKEEIKIIAKKFKSAKNFIYLGRGYGFPLALEGALKLKEISYIHAEGYPAAEMKHGPIALIDENMPVVFIANKGPSYEKVISNMMEVKARKGIIIAIVTKGDKDARKIADYYIEIPETQEIMMPFIASIPLQMLAYYIAVFRGCDVDKPRHLAKSVTVE